jgi:hypothetical protein
MHSSQGSLVAPIRKFLELFATPSRLTGLRGPICTFVGSGCQGAVPWKNLSEVSGYVASALVVFTFVAKDMRLLRTIAIFSNLAFITYGTIEWLPPVLFLHLLLLSLNIVRIREAVNAPQATGDLSQNDGAVPVQTLCAGMTAYGQPSAEPWPIFLSSAPSLANRTKLVIGRSP